MTGRRRTRGSIAAFAALALAATTLGAIATGSTDPASAITRSLQRIAGVDRYQTSVDLSVAAFPNGASQAVVASGAAFPDGLAAGPLGALLQGPVLLTTPDGMPPQIGTELQRLGATSITVIGGPAAVEEQVLDQIEVATGHRPTRVFGDDRYATAAAVAAMFPAAGAPAYVASGTTFPDALAGGAAAAAVRAPLLLVSPDAVSDAVAAQLTRLAPPEIRILGGPAAVSEAARARLATLAPSVRRQCTRPSFAADTDSGARPTEALVTTGITFPDALAAAGLATVHKAPIILTDTTCAPTIAVDTLRGLGWPDLIAIGGTASLTSSAAGIVPCAGTPDGLLAPGVTLTTQVLAGPRVVHILTIDRRQGFDVRPTMATGRLSGRMPVSDIARRWNALAAVNGDFFQGDGRPSHIFAEDGRLLQFPSDGTLVGFDPASSSYGFFGIPQTVVDVQVGADPTPLTLDLVNRGTPTGEQLALLTPESTAPPLPTGDWCRAELESGPSSIDSEARTRQAETVRVAACGSGVVVPRGRDVLVAPADSAAGKRIGALAPGTTLAVRWKMQPNIPGVLDVIGASNSLVFGATVATDVTQGTGTFYAQRAPRTAIAQRPNGDLLLVVVDGRRTGYSIGMTLRELADYLVDLGAIDAANLDGGGSSAMAVRGVLVSRPSDPGGERAVGSGLVIVPHGTPAPPPTGGAVVPPGEPPPD